jgi:multiple antibiotic resistance protein
MTALPLPLLASLLFALIGPIALIPLFATLAGAMSPAEQRRIAVRAFLLALVTLAIAIFAGASMLAKAGTSAASLMMAAGLILCLTAIRALFSAGSGGPAGPPPAPGSGAVLALTPIAIPGIVTPVGVAVIVIFVSYFPSLADRLAILGVVLAILLADLLAMLFAVRLMRAIGPAPLIVLGAVFGVLQAAMGIEMIVSGLGRSGLFG